MAEGDATVNHDMEEGYIINCPECGWDQAYIDRETPNGVEYICGNCGHTWFEEINDIFYPLHNP